MRSAPRVVLVGLVLVIAAGLLLVRLRPGMTVGGILVGAGRTARPPAVAGTFYPADVGVLRKEVQGYLQTASPDPQPGQLVALIVPHAGYVYSGAVAAYGYRLLEGARFDTVAVIGPSHRAPVRGLALSGADLWSTPLGPVELDRAGNKSLLKSDAAASLNEAVHRDEHSIEVQLPFLQQVLPKSKLLPVLMTDFSDRNCAAAAGAIADYARQRSVLLVASSDMSHYPTYEDAVRVDGETLQAIETLDANRLAQTTRGLIAEGVPNLGTCLCGEGPVKTVLMAARMLGADKAKVLKYANSGDVSKPLRDRVVGYCAVALYRTKESVPVSKPTESAGLSRAQQALLLTVARTAIGTYLETGEPQQFDQNDPELLRPGAAFVTLRKNGQLRGCIGTLEAEAPLIETVRDRAISAAFHDPRFPQVNRSELPHLEIEISVLSPLKQVRSAPDIDIRKHGVIVESGPKRGVFLPQVAEETGWDRDTLLSHLCRDKAGLPGDAWKQGAALYVFTVQAFSQPAPER
jgi:hypothetical protein